MTTPLRPNTLVTVFGKYKGITKPDHPGRTVPGMVRVVYAGEAGMQVAAYIPIDQCRERLK